MPSIAVRAENYIDSIQEAGPSEDLHLQPYFGYSTQENVIIRGRVLEADMNRASNDTPTLVDDLAAMAALFMTKEVEGEIVSIGDTSAISDSNGFYSIELPRKAPPAGWTEAIVTSQNTRKAVQHPVLITSKKAKYGIISNIDDTILHTKAWSSRKNLWTSVTGSVGSRYIFPDATTLLKLMAGSMSGRKNPVFYISSTPWNLHGFLDAVFMANGIVRGPKFLRDFSIDATKMVNDPHGTDKRNAIDTILAANPDLPFYLIGDSEQNDPSIYRDAVLRHPDRIKGVFIRTKNSSAFDEEACLPLKDIESNGVKIFAGQSFQPLLDLSF